ncbi:TlpA disulfide reductase family protein [Sphingobacterium sp.]|uniref:TlpA family protein disulfide reductase n=1 Tax=Sphingobacterium sp. TaxID=341027 RepID=UPI0028B0DCD5|nr:TlpA disulfide reductase family protein [Sphingobacterium sp.]
MKVFFATLLLSLMLINIAYAQMKSDPISLTDESYDKLGKKQLAQVSGRVLNATPEELANLKISYTFVNLIGPSQSSNETKVNVDGRFEFTQMYILPYQQVWFSLGDYAYTCLYLQDGLEITFDLNKLKKKKIYMIGDGITFAGKDAEVNRQMNEYILFDKKHNPDFYKPLQQLKPSTQDFQYKLDSLFTIQRKTNLAFYQTYGNSCKSLIDAATEAQYTYKKLDYYLTNKIKVANDSILVPIYSISNDVSDYFRFLHYYVKYVLYPFNETRGDYVKVMDYANQTFPKNYADIINLRFEDNDIAAQNKIYKTILNKLNCQWAKKNIGIEIDGLNVKQTKLEQLLVSSKTAPKQTSLGTIIKEFPFDAELISNRSKDGSELLKTIKAKYPNKLIVLDIWATWCAPCIGQMPYSKKLHHKAKATKLPVEFVYLCTDQGSNREKWINKVVELEQPGIHLFVNDSLITELFSLFNRSGFPTYAVIKPNGEIDTKGISWMSDVTLEKLKEMTK